jgi:hypothetical protein
MRAVCFDDQARLLAEEVDDIRSERLLPAKLGTLHSATANEMPQGPLCRSRDATKDACTVGRSSKHAAHALLIDELSDELRSNHVPDQ